MMMWKKINLMNSNSYLMSYMISMHDHLVMMSMVIMGLVLYYLIYSVMKYNYNMLFMDSHNLELIMTLLPVVILIMIAVPSMSILYIMEESSSMLTLKVLGHQWYWSYLLPELKLDINSYMKFNKLYNMRLIESDNYLSLPYDLGVRTLVSSEDVIHSWTVPSLGVKTDAIPGRINQLNFIMQFPGKYYGQCSEICGANHSFMPISIESLSMNLFLKAMK